MVHVEDMRRAGGAPRSAAMALQRDPELTSVTKKAIGRLSENISNVANDPALAFFRMEEHVRKSLPPMVEKRREISQLQQQLQGRCYDTQYAIGAVHSMQNSSDTLSNILEMLKSAIFHKQQLQCEETRRLSLDTTSPVDDPISS